VRKPLDDARLVESIEALLRQHKGAIPPQQGDPRDATP